MMFAHALFWTLVHSLWIGAGAAILAGAFLSATRKAPAAARYHGLCGIFLAFVVVVGVVFWRALGATQPGGEGLDRFSGPVVVIWLSLFSLQMIRLLRELARLRSVRREAIPAATDWTQKVLHFGRALGISRPVRLLESALVQVPVTIGHLKPVILLPLGLLTRLSPEQVEAILWHELAHVRRWDYLVNILQSVVEALFFFNPALRWISALIREERENCCDDLALSRVPQKRNYLEALLAFQGEAAPLALGFRGSPLMIRVRRMVLEENRRLHRWEKAALLAGVLLLTAFALLRPTQDPVIRFTHILFNKTDADPANREMLAKDDQGNRYYLRVASGRLVALEINGVKVSPETHGYVLRQVDEALGRKKRVPRPARSVARRAGSPTPTDAAPPA